MFTYVMLQLQTVCCSCCGVVTEVSYKCSAIIQLCMYRKIWPPVCDTEIVRLKEMLTNMIVWENYCHFHQVKQKWKGVGLGGGGEHMHTPTNPATYACENALIYLSVAMFACTWVLPCLLVLEWCTWITPSLLVLEWCHVCLYLNTSSDHLNYGGNHVLLWLVFLLTHSCQTLFLWKKLRW